ncbi:thioesterase [Spongiactinospora gelatinilytica]|uniref:Thioesterase n=1 Tax=Spongiactinospora gelatinilytica TaxID=2666298 RepID=A0A2W2HKW5_9ACTN|nr:hotdog domain-containing protein [Spongiactinospora gelatinilytica]PZG46567.1 thioesterase [Spongiactinospora gelatinilytica]
MTTTETGVHEPVQVHYDELDAMGLLHNSRYTLLVERAIITYWVRQGWAPDRARSAFEDVFLAVREVKMTYHAPVSGAGEVVVHFWIDRMGRTSAVYGFRVLSADRTVVHADGYRVNVNLDPATLRPEPFSAELRAAAEPLFTAEAAAC